MSDKIKSNHQVTFPLAQLAHGVYQQAAKKLIARAIATGTKVIIFEAGQIKHLDPTTIQLPQGESSCQGSDFVPV